MLVEVFNSKDSGQVHLAYSLLAAEELFVRLENEHTNEILGMSLGVSIMVREEDYAEARRLLEEAGYLPSESAEIEQLEAELARERKGLAKKMTFIVLGIIILLILSYFVSKHLV